MGATSNAILKKNIISWILILVSIIFMIVQYKIMDMNNGDKINNQIAIMSIIAGVINIATIVASFVLMKKDKDNDTGGKKALRITALIVRILILLNVIVVTGGAILFLVMN